MSVECIVKRLRESSKEEAWQYYEMPKDHKGPWTHPYYYKDYDKDILGLIYPPYEASSNFLKDMTHYDYVAELYDQSMVLTLDEKSFNNLEDAELWLDELAAYTVSKK